MKQIGNDPHFRWRGAEVSRIEALSDVVFGMALALLGVPLTDTGTIGKISDVIYHFPAFAGSFAVLITLWYSHHLIYRRYGLTDTRTNVLNATLLALIVFFVLPLRYVFNLVSSDVLVYTNLIDAPLIERPEIQKMLVLFGLGFLSIAAVFALLYQNALRMRSVLELTPSEVYQTRWRVTLHLCHIGVAVMSIVVTLCLHAKGGGCVYTLLIPLRVATWKKTHNL